MHGVRDFCPVFASFVCVFLRLRWLSRDTNGSCHTHIKGRNVTKNREPPYIFWPFVVFVALYWLSGLPPSAQKKE
jgi:hypothetical protein